MVALGVAPDSPVAVQAAGVWAGRRRGGLGRWRIYGIHLPDDVLKKVYYKNAAKLLGLDK